MVSKITAPAKPLEVIDKINELVDGKQDALTAGTNITITNNVISASGSTTTITYDATTKTLTWS